MGCIPSCRRPLQTAVVPVVSQSPAPVPSVAQKSLLRTLRERLVPPGSRPRDFLRAASLLLVATLQVVDLVTDVQVAVLIRARSEVLFGVSVAFIVFSIWARIVMNIAVGTHENENIPRACFLLALSLLQLDGFWHALLLIRSRWGIDEEPWEFQDDDNPAWGFVIIRTVEATFESLPLGILQAHIIFDDLASGLHPTLPQQISLIVSILSIGLAMQGLTRNQLRTGAAFDQFVLILFWICDAALRLVSAAICFSLYQPWSWIYWLINMSLSGVMFVYWGPDVKDAPFALIVLLVSCLLVGGFFVGLFYLLWPSFYLMFDFMFDEPDSDNWKNAGKSSATATTLLRHGEFLVIAVVTLVLDRALAPVAISLLMAWVASSCAGLRLAYTFGRIEDLDKVPGLIRRLFMFRLGTWPEPEVGDTVRLTATATMHGQLIRQIDHGSRALCREHRSDHLLMGGRLGWVKSREGQLGRWVTVATVATVDSAGHSGTQSEVYHIKDLVITCRAGQQSASATTPSQSQQDVPAEYAQWVKFVKESEIAWVSVRYLRDLVRQKKAMPRRQDIPPDALDVGSCGSFASDFRSVTRWAATHAWRSARHPDPDRAQLEWLVHELDRLGARDEDLVFFDFLSLYQHDSANEEFWKLACTRHEEKKRGVLKKQQTLWPRAGQHPFLRTKREEELFQKGLRGLEWIWSFETRVIVVPQPPCPGEPERDLIWTTDHAEHVCPANTNLYQVRGWCYFELAVSNLFCTIANKDDPDVELLCRSLPLDPAEFAKAFEVTSFTNSSDRGPVIKMFARLHRRSPLAAHLFAGFAEELQGSTAPSAEVLGALAGFLRVI